MDAGGDVSKNGRAKRSIHLNFNLVCNAPGAVVADIRLKSTNSEGAS